MSDEQPSSLTAISPQDLMPLYNLGGAGVHHQRLTPLIGEWEVYMEIYPAPGTDPIQSAGLIAQKRWIMDGREVLEEITAGSIGGMEHRKLTILGYDNVNQRYEFTTVDNLDTQTMRYQGTADASGKTITLIGAYTQAALADFVTGDGVGRASGGTPRPNRALIGIAFSVRDVLTIQDENHHTLQMYFTPATGSEILTAQYSYTRQ